MFFGAGSVITAGAVRLPNADFAVYCCGVENHTSLK